MIQIPYADIGLGVALILGIWAFLAAETIGARVVIAGIPVILFLVRVIFPSAAGVLVTLVGFMLYGIGCIIYVRYQGFSVR